MAQGIRAFFEANKTKIKTKPITVVYGSTNLPLEVEMVELADKTVIRVKPATYLMSIDSQGNTSDFKSVKGIEDPGAKMRAAVEALKKSGEWEGFSDAQLEKIAAKYGTKKGGGKGAGTGEDKPKKVKKEAGQKWKHVETGVVVTLTGLKGTSWLGKDDKKNDVQISGLTWGKYELQK